MQQTVWRSSNKPQINCLLSRTCYSYQNQSLPVRLQYWLCSKSFVYFLFIYFFFLPFFSILMKTLTVINTAHIIHQSMWDFMGGNLGDSDERHLYTPNSDMALRFNIDPEEFWHWSRNEFWRMWEILTSNCDSWWGLWYSLFSVSESPVSAHCPSLLTGA